MINYKLVIIYIFYKHTLGHQHSRDESSIFDHINTLSLVRIIQVSANLKIHHPRNSTFKKIPLSSPFFLSTSTEATNLIYFHSHMQCSNQFCQLPLNCLYLMKKQILLTISILFTHSFFISSNLELRTMLPLLICPYSNLCFFKSCLSSEGGQTI